MKTPQVPPLAGMTPLGIKPALPSWYVNAEHEIGFHEKGDNRGIEHYIALAHCGHLGDPWCAIFVNAMLEQAGIRGTRSPAALSFKDDHAHFVRLTGPAIGAIVCMWRISPTSGKGHVYFYGGEHRGDALVALGGNQDNKVCRAPEPRARVLGFYWPIGVRLPVTGPVYVDGLAKAGPVKET